MTTKDEKYFMNAFENQIKFIKRHERSNIGYGGDVMPILELYQSLSEYDERSSFKDTILKFLEDPDQARREFAVNLCLGFFIFRDAIGR